MIEEFYTIIGGQHRFQFLTMTLVIVAQMNMAMNILMTIFINNDQDMLCVVSVHESMSFQDQFKYIDNETGYVVLDHSRCTLKNVTDICSKIFLKANVMTTTIRIQYKLMCEYHKLTSLSVFLLMFGVFLGSLFGGMFVDRYGRRKGCFVSFYMLSLFASIAALSPWYFLHCVSRCIVGISISVGFVSTSGMILELVALKNRTVFGFFWSLGYDIGFLLLVQLAYFIRNHSHLQYTTTAISLLSLVVPFIYRESFRWLLANEHYDEAKETILYIAKFNQQSLSKSDADYYVHLYKENKLKQSIRKVDFKEILKYKVVLLNMVILWFIYFSCSFSYYTFLLGSSKVSNNLFIAAVISAVSAFLVRILVMIWSLKAGRVTIIIVLQSSLAVMFIGSIILKIILGGDNIATTVLLMLAIAISGTNFGFMWIYGGEAFPTVIRSTSVSIGSACARISGMIASQMEMVFEVSPNLLPIIGALMALTAALTALFVLPETHKRTSLDFLEQAETSFVEWRLCPLRKHRVDSKFNIKEISI